MSDNKGWIKLHRSIKDCWIWNVGKYDMAHAWIDLLLSANHADNKIFLDGVPVIIERGQFHTSLQVLAEKWRWNRKTVSRFLNVLENDGMVTQKRNSRGTTITIVNYSNYQDIGTAEWTPNGTPNGTPIWTPEWTPNGTSDGTQTRIKELKNEKNDKELKNERSIGAMPHAPKFIKPTLEEVEDFIKEKGYSVNADSFWNYYESNGWKVGKNPMKNWKASISQWNSRKDEKPKSEYMEAIKNRVNIVDSWV